MVAAILGKLLAGLALFFYGLGGVKTGMKTLSGRRVRQVMVALTRHLPLAVLAGMAFGAITQSATAASFLLASMVATGMVEMRRVLPVLAGANVGTALLVFLVSFNIELAILWVIGTSGMTIALGVPGRFRVFFALLFSIGLLFFGLGLMKQAFQGVQDYPWITDLKNFIGDSYFITFIVGALFRIIIQSSSAIAVIGLTLAESGIISEGQVVILIFGTGPGVALAAYFLSAGVQGVPRQIILYQSLINLLGGVLMLALFYIEALFDVPLVLAFIDRNPHDYDTATSFAYLFLMLAHLSWGLVLLRWAPDWLERFSPATPDQDLSKPRYLDENVLDQPELAMDLIEAEQVRVLRHFADYLAIPGSDIESQTGLNPDKLHESLLSLDAEIRGYQSALVSREMEKETSNRLLREGRNEQRIMAIDEALHTLGVMLHHASTDGPEALRQPAHDVAVGCHVLLDTMVDTFRHRTEENLDLAAQLTSDREERIEKFRHELMAEHEDKLSHEDCERILRGSSAYIRVIWECKQLVASLKRQRAEGVRSSLSN